MKFNELIPTFNKMFNARISKASIVAMWSEEQLRSFTDGELRFLKQESQFFNNNRLILRINNVQRERAREQDTGATK